MPAVVVLRETRRPALTLLRQIGRFSVAPGLDLVDGKPVVRCAMDQNETDNITALLHAWKQDHDASARDQLFELIEKELTSHARLMLARVGGVRHKIDPGDLVGDLYLRLERHQSVWENRHYFYGMVRKVMRNILLDVVKKDEAAKRPPSTLRLGQEALDLVPAAEPDIPIESFYQALDKLDALNPWQAQAVEMHYLVGVGIDNLAKFANISSGTVKRDLKLAKAWLKIELAQS